MASFDSTSFDTGSFSELAFFFGAVTPTVTEEESPTGGFWFAYEKEKIRKENERSKRRRLRTRAKKVRDDLHRELALAERLLEEEQSRLRELKAITELTKTHKSELLALKLSKIDKAMDRAINQMNYSAMEALERELARLAEEDELMIISAMILLNQ